MWVSFEALAPLLMLACPVNQLSGIWLANPNTLRRFLEKLMMPHCEDRVKNLSCAGFNLSLVCNSQVFSGHY